MKIHAGLLLAATLVSAPHSASAATLGLSVTLSSLDSNVCNPATGECTETTQDIAPVEFGYSRSFDPRFDGFAANDWSPRPGKTIHQSGSFQSLSVESTRFDHDPLLAFLPAVNITAEQFATGTNSNFNEYFQVEAGKTVITQEGRGITLSEVSGELLESQQWTTTLASGAWLSTGYSIEFSLYENPVPMTVDDVATPTSFASFEAMLEQQLLSGGDIPVYVGYTLFDGANLVSRTDSYVGVAHLTSLDGLAPVPDAPAALMLLAGLLVIGTQMPRPSTRRAGGGSRSR